VKRIEAGELVWFESEKLAAAGARAAFSTRRGGYSPAPYSFLNLGLHVGDDEIAVLNNRLDYWRALGIDPEGAVGARQVHGTRVTAATAADRGKGAASWSHAFPASDGLVTLDAGVPLFTLAADCYLVALAAPEGKGVAALHAGWRGLVGGIVERGAGLLAGLAGRKPEELVAFVGAGLGEECFEVREDFAGELSRAWGPEAVGEFVKREGEKSFFRYEAALLRAFEKAGLKRENIEMVGGCTACRPELYYSHRASGGRAGRMAMTAWVP